jgi:glycosyltransferase involved in cell wall biosynthesis
MTSPTHAGSSYVAPDASIVSVITPLFIEGIDFIADAWESVQSQQLPADMSLEWVVQEDADHPEFAERLAELVGGDSRVRYAFNGRHCGQAVTRNMAFQRSRGQLIYALDQDDILLPGALHALASEMALRPEVMWVTGHTQRLFDDGSVVERDDPIEDGPLPAGYLLELFEKGITIAFYATATMFRRSALQLLGGWPAIVAGEDSELQLAMGAAFDGFRCGHLLVSRRKWAGQAVQAGWYATPDLESVTPRYARALAIDAARRAGMFTATS